MKVAHSKLWRLAIATDDIEDHVIFVVAGNITQAIALACADPGPALAHDLKSAVLVDDAVISAANQELEAVRGDILADLRLAARGKKKRRKP